MPRSSIPFQDALVGAVFALTAVAGALAIANAGASTPAREVEARVSGAGYALTLLCGAAVDRVVRARDSGPWATSAAARLSTRLAREADANGLTHAALRHDRTLVAESLDAALVAGEASLAALTPLCLQVAEDPVGEVAVRGATR